VGERESDPGAPLRPHSAPLSLLFSRENGGGKGEKVKRSQRCWGEGREKKREGNNLHPRKRGDAGITLLDTGDFSEWAKKKEKHGGARTKKERGRKKGEKRTQTPPSSFLYERKKKGGKKEDEGSRQGGRKGKEERGADIFKSFFFCFLYKRKERKKRGEPG